MGQRKTGITLHVLVGIWFWFCSKKFTNFQWGFQHPKFPSAYMTNVTDPLFALRRDDDVELVRGVYWWRKVTVLCVVRSTDVCNHLVKHHIWLLLHRTEVLGSAVHPTQFHYDNHLQFTGPRFSESPTKKAILRGDGADRPWSNKQTRRP